MRAEQAARARKILDVPEVGPILGPTPRECASIVDEDRSRAVLHDRVRHARCLGRSLDGLVVPQAVIDRQEHAGLAHGRIRIGLRNGHIPVDLARLEHGPRLWLGEIGHHIDDVDAGRLREGLIHVLAHRLRVRAAEREHDHLATACEPVLRAGQACSRQRGHADGDCLEHAAPVDACSGLLEVRCHMHLLVRFGKCRLFTRPNPA